MILTAQTLRGRRRATAWPGYLSRAERAWLTTDPRTVLENAFNLYLTTTGRHSGQPRQVHLWFVYDEPRVALLALVFEDSGPAEWFLNLEADPACVLDVEGSRYRARAVTLEDDGALEADLRARFREKYGAKPFDRWYGDAEMRPVVLEVLGPAEEDSRTPYSKYLS